MINPPGVISNIEYNTESRILYTGMARTVRTCLPLIGYKQRTEAWEEGTRSSFQNRGYDYTRLFCVHLVGVDTQYNELNCPPGFGTFSTDLAPGKLYYPVSSISDKYVSSCCYPERTGMCFYLESVALPPFPPSPPASPPQLCFSPDSVWRGARITSITTGVSGGIGDVRCLNGNNTRLCATRAHYACVLRDKRDVAALFYSVLPGERLCDGTMVTSISVQRYAPLYTVTSRTGPPQQDLGDVASLSGIEVGVFDGRTPYALVREFNTHVEAMYASGASPERLADSGRAAKNALVANGSLVQNFIRLATGLMDAPPLSASFLHFLLNQFATHVAEMCTQASSYAACLDETRVA
jgi:hypothetical protein